MKMNAVPNPRIFGPVSRKEAETIVEMMLESNSFKESMIKALCDEETIQGFAYEFQVEAEATDAEINNVSSYDGWGRDYA